MTMIKNSVVELFILLLLACTVFIYKDTFNKTGYRHH